MRTQGVIGLGAEARAGQSRTRGSDLQTIVLDIARRRDRLAEQVRAAQPRSTETLQLVLEELHVEQPRLLAHARRVADAALAIARTLPLPELKCQHVYRAALVHDIGKLAFPPTLIDKDGQFSSEELAVIRTHTIAGAAILINVPYLHATAAVVAATHERWAGGGFPRGLFNDAIPMPSRIIAVADAFDALTGHVGDADDEIRDAANAELVRYAGSHFDPAVVRAWLRVPESEPVAC
jgi:HD-GYP domain-containing protein (c-di-GMP phosphodiesterase class II)